ncbi:sterile alpha motif domain-containing protein 12-like [Bombina bombina]|uniref:sterile alpha motif domain-containing protein 12-like n=1 Tax=Bombina bombina TaxID=8345 RepID=UPI00235AD33E|nr:sterile alpha motif domain-containing protein 12-like [Bombina bombina]XP_053565418.1 sterile alpha motif domain-containing protein 12-like [Bombina bombina]XP_053565419.1 sterile alpha motif domain-containing protein 12-like [Bombina bombina]
MADFLQISDDEDILEKPVCDWTVHDVCHWLQIGPLQDEAGLFQAVYTHNISGRALLRLTDNLLQRMGIDQKNQRRVILIEVLQLRLQQEVQQLLYITQEQTSERQNTLNFLRKAKEPGNPREMTDGFHRK